MRHLFLSFALLAACGPDARNTGVDAPGGQKDASGDGQTTDQSLVYAHSGTVLYRIDTASLQPVQIGNITGIGTEKLTDLAVDKSNNMLGVTLTKLYKLDAATGAATFVKALGSGVNGATSLSFLPNPTTPGGDDILVTVSDSDVEQIDQTSGNLTKVGSYGTSGSQPIVSSGDLVGVVNLGIYATVDVGTNKANNDFLAKIDPVSYKATIIGSGTGFNNIFGLAYWAGKLYGFVDNGTGQGKLITIDLTTGVGHEVLADSIQWYGAGNTTIAPVIL